MSITEDMMRELGKARRQRAAKKSLGFPEPHPVFVVNQHAYMADAVRRTRDDPTTRGKISQVSLYGVPVEFGALPGWKLEWRS